MIGIEQEAKQNRRLAVLRQCYFGDYGFFKEPPHDDPIAVLVGGTDLSPMEAEEWFQTDAAQAIVKEWRRAKKKAQDDFDAMVKSSQLAWQALYVPQMDDL